MNNNFLVEKVDNGYVVRFNREFRRDDDSYDFEEKTFVFEKVSALKKGLKVLVEQLTEKGV